MPGVVVRNFEPSRLCRPRTICDFKSAELSEVYFCAKEIEISSAGSPAIQRRKGWSINRRQLPHTVIQVESLSGIIRIVILITAGWIIVACHRILGPRIRHITGNRLIYKPRSPYFLQF